MIEVSPQIIYLLYHVWCAIFLKALCPFTSVPASFYGWDAPLVLTCACGERGSQLKMYSLQVGRNDLHSDTRDSWTSASYEEQAIIGIFCDGRLKDVECVSLKGFRLLFGGNSNILVFFKDNLFVFGTQVQRLCWPQFVCMIIWRQNVFLIKCMGVIICFIQSKNSLVMMSVATVSSNQLN